MTYPPPGPAGPSVGPGGHYQDGPPAGPMPGPLPGPPPGPPRPPNRTPLLIGAAVVVAAAVGLFVVVSGDDEPTAPTTTAPQTAPTADGSDNVDTNIPEIEEQTPPDVSQLEVIDQGFSVFERSNGLYGSYGFVLENAADEPFEDIPITVSFLDSAGTVVGDIGGLGGVNIGLIPAGETFVVAGLLNTAGFGGLDAGTTEVTEMVVEIGEPGFQATHGDPPPEGELEISDISSRADSETDETTLFTVTSTYEHQISSPEAYVLYRNAEGAIIGGVHQNVGTPFIPAGGEANFEVTSTLVVENLGDIASTEVSVDPGLKAGLPPGG